MTHRKVNYEEVDPVADGMHFLRDPLECERLGLTVLDCEAGWTGKEHDHADREHEEIYYLVSGEATVAVEGQEVVLEPGDAVRVDPSSTRQIHVETDDTTLVLAGAP